MAAAPNRKLKAARKTAHLSQPVSRLLIVSSSLKKDFRVLQVIPPASNIQVNIRSMVLSRYRIQLKNIIPRRI